MRVYLAARYERRYEMQEVARVLEGMGHTVTSRWIQGHNAPYDSDVPTLKKLSQQFAYEDIEDINKADSLVLFTEKERVYSRGGRHVELGMAVAWGLQVILVGPRENVFHCIDEITEVPNVESLYLLLHREMGGEG